MPSSNRTPRVITAARAAMNAQNTNPYRIAQASGLPVSSVQNLLMGKISPSVHNIEVILEVLGFEVRVVKVGPPLAKPGRSVPKTKRG
jgi:hypothetical protein